MQASYNPCPKMAFDRDRWVMFWYAVTVLLRLLVDLFCCRSPQVDKVFEILRHRLSDAMCTPIMESIFIRFCARIPLFSNGGGMALLFSNL